MMNIFKIYMNELPPFAEFWQKHFYGKRMLVVNKKSGMKVSHIANAIDELFNPVRETNKECTPRLLDLVKVGMTRWREEMLNPKKATY